MKISSKYKEKANLYKCFSRHWEHMLDYSEEALLECYMWETHGNKIANSKNGFVIGKRWLDVNIAMWKEDIAKGILYPFELEELECLVKT